MRDFELSGREFVCVNARVYAGTRFLRLGKCSLSVSPSVFLPVVKSADRFPFQTKQHPVQTSWNIYPLLYSFSLHISELSHLSVPHLHTRLLVFLFLPRPSVRPFFPPLQTSTLAPQTDLSARTTAASLCAGCVTGIMTAGMTRMSPTPPVQVDKDSFILGRFGGFFLFMT